MAYKVACASTKIIFLIVTDKPIIKSRDARASDHLTSGSDSDFVRINLTVTTPSMVQEMETPAEQDENEGACTSPPAMVHEEDPHWNHSFQASPPLSASSYSLPGDAPLPVFPRRRPPRSMEDISGSHGRFDDIGHGHGRYHRLHRHRALDEDGDLDDIPEPSSSQRHGGEEGFGRHLAWRLQRDMFGSASSSASDLSSFSFLGLRRQASKG